MPILSVETCLCILVNTSCMLATYILNLPIRVNDVILSFFPSTNVIIL